MVSPERRAWSRAAASDFSDGSIRVTVAPWAGRVSARMPPPPRTSRTRSPPHPPNTRRKYSPRTAFSSCSPANGPASLHHTPGTRSTRRSYFSGSERPPRRGSWSDMPRNLRREGGGGGVGGGGGGHFPPPEWVPRPARKRGRRLGWVTPRPAPPLSPHPPPPPPSS